MAETTSADRQTPSPAASVSGNQKADPPRAKLALWTWLLALLFGLLFGAPALWLKQQQARSAAQAIVENQAILGSQAIVHHLKLRRESRSTAFSAVATRPRAIDSGRHIWDQVAQETRSVGADLVVVVDEAGALLAQDGAGASGLLEAEARNGLTPTGSLRALGSQLVEAFQFPVSYDGKPGFLIAACRILPETLRQDAEPLGLGVALSLEGAYVTNLPADALSSGRWGDDPRETLHNLAVRYHLLATPLWQGRLLVAVPLENVQKWSKEQFADALLLLGLLCGALLLLAASEQLLVLSPLLRMAEAASRVAPGGLARVRALLKQLLDRHDEISATSRGFDLAVQRLQSLVLAGTRLLESTETSIGTIDRISNSLTTTASNQDERSKEVLSQVVPQTKAVERLTRQMVEVRNAVVQISLAWSTVDQAQTQVASALRRADSMMHNPDTTDGRTYRAATIGQQLQQMTQSLTEEREALGRMKEHLGGLRATVDGAMDSVGFDDTTGATIGRSLHDISRGARQQLTDLDALRGGLDQLRKDSERLSSLISAVQHKTGEDLSSMSGNYQLGSGPRVKRTSDASRSSVSVPISKNPPASSSPALRPAATSPVPPPKSSIPPASTSGERRVSGLASAHSPRSSVSGSSPSLRPVGSQSSPMIKPLSASSQSLRPISFPEGLGRGRDRDGETGHRRERLTGPSSDPREARVASPLSAKSPKVPSKPPTDSKTDE